MAADWPHSAARERPDARIVALLQFLADDPADATAALEEIRRALVQMARYRCAHWRLTLDPEDLVQDTILRVADQAHRKALTRDNPKAYFLTTLDFIILEGLRTRRLEQLPEDVPAPRPAESLWEQCEGFCFKQLEAADRQLLARYYAKESPSHRTKLADDLATTYGALRVKVHKLRSRLRACVSACNERSVSR